MEIITAFFGGLLASLSPCIYPMIPLFLAFLGTQDKSRSIIMFTCAKVAAFLVLGLFAVEAGEILGYTSQLPAVQIAMGAFLVVFGICSFFNYMPKSLGLVNKAAQKLEGSAILLGIGSALLVTPCNTAILASVLMVVATSPSKLYGMSVMLAYAIGFSIVMFILGIGYVKKLPKSGKWMKVFHRVSSASLIALGAYYLYCAF